MYLNKTRIIFNYNQSLLKSFTIISYLCEKCLSTGLSAMCSSVKALVICGPSGSGKSTLLNKLITQFSHCFRFSVSHTTRSPRIGEVNGKEYYFIDQKTFENMINKKEFVEFAQFSGNYYGTSIHTLEDVQKSGRIPILDLDIKGVLSLKEINFKANYVFIKPPNIEALEKNLRNRGTEDQQSLQKRLSRALEDIKLAESGFFDLIIVNDNLDDAYQQLKQFVQNDINEVQKLLEQQKNT